MSWSGERAVRRALALAFSLMAAACGGGGADTSHIDNQIQDDPLRLIALERADEPRQLLIEIGGFEERDVVYVGVEGTESLFSDVTVLDGPLHEKLRLQVQPRTDLAAGTHEATMVVTMCRDAQCTRHYRGSPARIPVTLDLRPNIGLQPEILIERSGTEAPPQPLVPLTVPDAAGNVFISLEGDDRWHFTATLVDGGVRIVPERLRAGTYEVTLKASASSGFEYRAEASVRYVVTPPPGGEHELSVSDPEIWFAVAEGGLVSKRFQVTRPTWTPLYEPPQFDHPGCLQGFSLVDLGNDLHEVSFRAPVALPSHYYCEIVVSGGDGAGTQRIQVRASTS